VKELLDLRGIVTVLNTPFTRDDRIDVDSLSVNITMALDAGVAGFLVPAMASEVGRLTESERELLVATVLEVVKGQVPVIGGASAATAEVRIRAARSLIAMGCDGVLVSIPYKSDQQYEAAVCAVAELGPGFLMLQDWDFHGYGLPVPLVVRLFEEVDVFRSLKIEVVPGGVKYTEILEATDGRLHVASGWGEMQMIEAFDRGVHALMPTGIHAVYTRIYSLYTEGDRAGARDLFERLLPVLAFSNQHLDISIHFFKRLLHRQGVYATPRVREPILPFDDHHAAIADELIDRVMALTTSLDSGEPS